MQDAGRWTFARWSVARAVLLAGGLIAATAPAGAAGLTRGLVGSVETLDPQKAATASETALLVDLFDGLVIRDGAGKLVPGAAASWTISPDGLTYTFALREGARWSNGDPVKASDFVASFRRLFDPATGATEDGPLQVIAKAGAIKAGFAKPDVLGVAAPDEKTLEIRLDKVTPTFLGRLAAPVAMPVNVAAAKKLGTNFASGAKLVSNGAYMIGAAGSTGGKYALAVNPRHGGDAPAIASVLYRAFEDAAACLDAYRAGTVDICPDVPTGDIAALKAEFGRALRIAPYAGTYFYVVNTTRKPFDDARVRRALSLAIDREALAASAWSGGMLPADDLVPAALSPLPAAAETPITTRQAEARTLLSAAGYGPRKPLALTIRLGSGMAHETTAKLVIAGWKAIGVDGQIVTDPESSHYAALRDTADFDLAAAGWIADEPDALDMLQLLKSNGRFNYGRYANHGFDGLVSAAGAETDPARRGDEIAKAEALVRQDAPVIPLLSYAALGLVSAKVTGWTDNLVDLHPARTLALTD